jgi:hypothetical protein
VYSDHWSQHFDRQCGVVWNALVPLVLFIVLFMLRGKAMFDNQKNKKRYLVSCIFATIKILGGQGLRLAPQFLSF